MRFLGFSLFLLCVLQSYGQQTPADSVSRLLEVTESVDERLMLQKELLIYKDSRLPKHAERTGQMDLSKEEERSNLFQLVTLYARVTRQLDSAEKYLADLKLLLPHSKLPEESIDHIKYVILEAGIRSLREHNPRPLFEVYLDQLPFFENMKVVRKVAPEVMAVYYTDLAELCMVLHKWDSASIFVQRAQVYAKRSGHSVIQYRVRLKEAQLFHDLGSYGRTLATLRALRKTLGNSEITYDMADYYSQMAYTLLELNKPNQAILYGDSCLVLTTKYHYSRFYTRTLNLLSWAYASIGDSDKCQLYTEMVEKEYMRRSTFQRLPVVYTSLANYKLDNGLINEAKQHLLRSIELCNRYNLDEYKAITEIVLSRAYLMEKDYASVLQQLHPTQEELLLSSRNYQSLLLYYQIRGEAFSKSEQWESAHEMRTKEMAIADTLKGQEEIKQLILARTDNEEHILQLQLLENEMLIEKGSSEKRILTITIVGIAAVAVLLIVLLLQRLKNRQQRNRLEVSSVTLRNAKLQMKTLQSQINPHFIFNSLNTFQYMVRDNQSEVAVQYVGQFANLLREVLNHSGEEFITIEQELEMLKKYVEIELVRIDKKVDFTIDISSELNPSELLIPPMLIQPLIENALWHGVTRSEEDGKIAVVVDYFGDTSVRITITDNGKGYEPSASNPKRKSYGLSNVRERLASMSSVYHYEASLELINLKTEGGQGTRQTVIIPIVEGKVD